MIKIVARHLVSLLTVTLLLGALIITLNRPQADPRTKALEEWLQLPFLDVDDPADRVLLREMLDYYEPDRETAHRQLVDDLAAESKRRRLEMARGTMEKKSLDTRTAGHILYMFFMFTLIFICALLISYYGALTLGTLRFIYQQQQRPSAFRRWLAALRARPAHWRPQTIGAYARPLLKQSALLLGRFFAYAVLFSPAYVLAYSFKSRFDSDMFLFVIVLGVISNGMLITYTRKFYTFLDSESRKGFVDLARVKQMHDSHAFNKRDGIAWKQLLRWKKQFPGHVLGVIYENAHYQYTQTLKEQAAYLISSLIITEMALNVQGHLSYSMLQYLYYGDYAPVALIVLCLFWLVKLTELVVDLTAYRRDKKLGYH